MACGAVEVIKCRAPRRMDRKPVHLLTHGTGARSTSAPAAAVVVGATVAGAAVIVTTPEPEPEPEPEPKSVIGVVLDVGRVAARVVVENVVMV